jgi:threonyl-tRNA synthetase
LAKYNLNDQDKGDEVGRACSTHGEKWNAYRVLVGKAEEKRLLERPRRRWKDNTKLDLRERR